MFACHFRKHLLIHFMVLHGLAILSVEAKPENRWDWAEMTDEEIAFCDTYMPPFLEMRKTKGDEVALRELDRIYALAEDQFEKPRFFHRVVWYEAQAHSGKEDEAWGQVLYEYLFDRDVVNNPKRTCSCRLHANDYILCGNIMENCMAQGKAARAREYGLKIEDSLEADRGFDLTGASYTDKGPIFTFLDHARDREYPVYNHDLHPEQTNPDQRRFIYYPNIYGLTFLADTALRSGDWIKAAELSAWCIRYTDEYMKGDNKMRGEVGRVASYDSRKRLADLARLHGYPEEAARFIREAIVRAEGYYEANEKNVLMAKLELAVIRIQMDELTEADLALADKAEEKIMASWWETRSSAMTASLNKARIYHALDRKKEAWEIVGNLMDQAQADVNPYHWVQMLDTAIDLALEDGAVRTELEDWLVLALNNARLTGNKFEELPLYEKYARFLRMHGRYLEAARIQQEAVRLSKAMSLPKRLQDNMDILADIHQELEIESVLKVVDNAEGEQAPDESGAAPEAVAATSQNFDQSAGGSGSTQQHIAVDIQPRLSFSAALQGQAAYGRFYLHNPSFAIQKGTLSLSGPIDQIQWQNAQWLTVNASPVFETAALERTLQLEAGASCIIDIIGLPLEDGRGAEVQCRWIPENLKQTETTGSWSYQTAETEKRTAVIDAHELRNNPFYLIPIHHMVQRIDSTSRQIMDFSIEASSPMRIETYDASTGKLLAVDANGDGDFFDSGDLIVGDDNRNNWPDLTFEENQNMASLVMYVKPGQAEATDAETQLTVKTKTDGEWQTDAIDMIKPYIPAER